MNQKLVEILRTARLEKNLKQEEVAKVLGVKKNTISNYENGKSEPDIDSLITMCRLYGIDYATTIRKAYSEEKEKAPASENSETEAQIEERAVKLYRALLNAGLIVEGQELTEEQIDFLDGLAAILPQIFKKTDK